ncbi:MAG: hypothetical protein IJV74_03765 [Clostridia bacterium]|nr:hypothetical protein [Clostridia bacterium]
MATETTNYKLKKPGASDYYDIEIHNSNMELIDALLKAFDAGKINAADIVNSLTSSETAKPLSAAQGMALKKLIDGITVNSIGAAAASHTHAASTITAGTFAATGVKAAAGTDYTYERLRNMSLNAAETNPTENGAIAWTYE